ncbi:MAG: STAS-like domain-containing protein [Gammaproteobacteria bacterium]|nr:STAS-like domain-containing protein [Gammaproteobacteria bacterium]
MKEVDVGREFYHRLANRNRYQGDGRYTAEHFRGKYLYDLDKEDAWKDDKISVVFNFENVKKIGPSFANEAFAYFMKYATPKQLKEKIRFKNISGVQELIIEQELESGYSR